MHTTHARREAAMTGRTVMRATAILSFLFFVSVSAAGLADSATSGDGLRECERAAIRPRAAPRQRP